MLGVEVRTVDGEQVQGEVRGLSNESATLTVRGESHQISAANLLDIRFPHREQPVLSPASAKPDTSTPLEKPVENVTTVWLTEGSRLRANRYSSTEKEASFTTLGQRSLKVSSKMIRAVRFPGGGVAADKQWQELFGKELETDSLLIEKEGQLDVLEGVVLEVSDTTIQFDIGVRVPVSREMVRGILYYHPSEETQSKAVCLAHLSNGILLAVNKINLVGNSLEMAAVGSGWKVATEQMDRLDFSRGKIEFLADLSPIRTSWTPYLAVGKSADQLASFFHPRMNQALRGGPLQLAGREYERGISLHSRTEIVFKIPRTFRQFRAIAGIDDRVWQGDVQLIIRTDDKVVFDKEIASGETPVDININFDKATQLSILVDYGNNADVADHLDLAEARFLK